MNFLRPKFKKLKNKKFSKFTIWHYILIIAISTLLFVGVILFFYQYILGVSESNDSDVLQASAQQRLTVRPIDKYHIEYTDLDGKTKSIRPKDCFGFDDVEYGVTSSMKRICRRNYMIGDVFPPIKTVSNDLGIRKSTGQVLQPTLDPYKLSGVTYPSSVSYSGNPNNPFQHWWEFGDKNYFDGFYIGGRIKNEEFFSFSNAAGTDSQGYKNNPFLEKDKSNNQVFPLLTPAYWQAFKDMYIFREFNEGGNPIQEPLPILTEYRGVPLMFYYGGVYEINRNSNSAFLITRLFDTYGYYSKACTSKNMPKAVYQVENGPSSQYVFRSPIELQLTEQYCKNCGYSNNFSKNCGLGITGLKCKQLGIGLNLPELFQDISNNSKGTPWWSDQLTCRKFNDVNSRYFTGPDLDQLIFQNSIAGCDFYNSSCLGLSERRVKVSNKFTTSNINTAGAAIDSVFNCIGLYEGDKCAELIESTVKEQVGSTNVKNYRRISGADASVNPESYSNSSFREATSGNVRFVNCNNNSSCYNAFDLLTSFDDVGQLQKTRFYPFVSETDGYELPYNIFSNTENNSIRAIDYNENGRVVIYPSGLNSSGRQFASSTNQKVLNESEVDYFFSDDYYNYAIDLRGSSFIVYRFWVAPDTENSYFIDSTPPVSIPSNLAKKENITVTYSTQSRTIQQRASNSVPRTYETEVFDILFSDKVSQSSTTSRFYRFSSRKQDLVGLESGYLSEIIDQTNLIPDALRNSVILNFKRYPSPTSNININNDYYVWVTPNLVYTSGVVPFTEPVCVIPPTSAFANITNTSPNSNLTTSWPLSYNETAAKRLIVNVGATSTTPITCNGQRITGATISLSRIDSPSKIFTFTATGNTATPQNNTLVFGAPNLPTIPSNMDYQIRSLNLTIGNQVVTLTPTSHPNLFGTRGWDIYTENIVRVRIATSPQPFPLTISVDKYRSSSPVAIRKFPNLSVNNVFDSFSNNIPGFFYDGEYTSSLDNFYYDMCFPPSLTISSFSSNNTNIELSRNGLSCLRFRSKSSSRGVPQEVTISLASSTSGSPSNEMWNGNLYIKNATGVSMLQKPANAKVFEGILFSNEANNNSWSRYLKESQFFHSYFKENQISLQGFFASSSLNLGVNGSEFYLLREPSSPVEGTGSAFPAGNYVTLSDPNSSTKDFHIIAVSKGRGISFNLTNSFLVNQKIDNFAFVNMSGKQPERIRFFADCSNPNYSYICGNQFKYIFRAPIYGSYIVDFKNAPSSSGSNLVITENPDLLMQLIPVIRSKKMNLVTTTFININYLD